MAAAVKVPAIFEAIDKFTAPVRRMMGSTTQFAAAVETSAARANRAFNAITPSISAAGAELLSFAKTAALTAGLVSLAHFSYASITEYGDAVAAFRVIVSDLTNNEFAAFQDKIGEVARDTKASSIQVAQSFEKIAGLNAKFAETADGLGKISTAAIILSKASGEELGVSAENLVGIMNQFSLGAEDANRTINALAAGTAVGAASIAQTTEAFKNFGPVAASFNIPLENSVALIQTLAKYSINGAEAGTKLRGSIGKLEEAGYGYRDGVFNINTALSDASKKMASFGSEQEKNAFITKTFGLENKTAGLILLNNIDTYQEFTKGVTGTNEALKAAEIRSDTLSVKFEELKNKYVTLITTNNQTTGAVGLLKSAIGLLTDNLELVMGAAMVYIGALVALKVVTVANTIRTTLLTAATAAQTFATKLGTMAQWQLSAALLIGLARMKLVALGTWLTTTATGVFTGALSLATMAQWALNAAMLANPIGLIIVAIVALIAVVAIIVAKYDDFGASLTFLLGPLGMVINLIMAFRRNWEMITDSFKNGGIIAGIKAIGATILDAILYPLQQVMQIWSNMPGFMGGNAAAGAASSIEQFRGNLGASSEAAPAVNPKAAQQNGMRQMLETTTNNNSNMIIDFKNMPKGVDVGGDYQDMMPNLGTTYGF
jgi:TP901 family phage tail tape measure protein